MEDSVGHGGRRDWFATINVCGAIAGALLFGTALTGILVEAGQLWREGAAFFFSDAGMRLFAGACLGILGAAPYLLLAKASRKTGPPMLFLVAAILMLAFQLWFMTYTLFLARSSTAAVALMFMPLYLGVTASAIWVAAALAHGMKLRRSP